MNQISKHCIVRKVFFGFGDKHEAKINLKECVLKKEDGNAVEYYTVQGGSPLSEILEKCRDSSISDDDKRAELENYYNISPEAFSSDDSLNLVIDQYVAQDPFSGCC